MEALHEKIQSGVAQWRKEGYPCGAYPLLKAMLGYQASWDGEAARPRYLRSAQLLALETYWFLRVVKKTPGCLELYKACYAGEELLQALGVPYDRGALKYGTPERIIADFMREDAGTKSGLDSLHESLALPYPSYIFALAMGAGKTVLIGAIIATEFALGMAYPDAAFMQNALVFAPGTTIIESLRELSEIPYQAILPPAQHQLFMANLKLSYASDKSKELSALKESRYNLIVSNTEKIILRKKSYRGHARQQQKIKEAREELAENARLGTLASLPKLGVFSDEAHHTYGNKAGDKLKRVRETINHLHRRTPLLCVVNTTGTPYYKKQLLKDVVIWYGIAEAIQHNVLKSLADGVREYEIAKGLEAQAAGKIIHNFYGKYKDVSLPGGQKAKIAFYFKRQADLDRARPAIERALAEVGESPSTVLVNTQTSTGDALEEFNRLNSPDSAKRVILLIEKGREGWNCPSLFACALITQQTSASNFVLQAAARCLRQVPGNEHAARVYLDLANRSILNKELQENFGGRISLYYLAHHLQEQQQVSIQILKTQLPPLEIVATATQLVKKANTQKPLLFTPPQGELPHPELVRHYEIRPAGGGDPLVPSGSSQAGPDTTMLSVHAAAVRIAAPLHLNPMEVLQALLQAYPGGVLPTAQLPSLHQQAERSLGEYEERKETITRVLALIHTHSPEGKPLFDECNGALYHTLRISAAHLAEVKRHWVDQKHYTDPQDLSFHYDPYNLDSADERDFFIGILNRLNIAPAEISGFYFTGGLRDPNKTEFWFHYQAQDGSYHKYYPDFVLLKHDGSCFIIEIKSERDAEHPETLAKAAAVQRIAGMQPERVKYHVIYSQSGKDIVHNWLET